MAGKLLFTGCGSRIYDEFVKLVPEDVEVSGWIIRTCDMSRLCQLDVRESVICSAGRIVIAHGCVSSVPFTERRQECMADSLMVNMLSAVKICEMALRSNPSVRICVIGSESGEKGSYDIPYWMAKAGLHSYVRERRIEHPGQQLVAVAPSTIVDSRMTEARSDQHNVERSCRENPKGRGCTSAEVARLIHYLLFQDDGYICNEVISMSGGKFSRNKKTRT